MAHWIECWDTFDNEPYGRRGPFATYGEADQARAERLAEIRQSQADAGSLQDTVRVYQTDDPDGEPSAFLPYRLSPEGR